jgi:hypothetical protein
LLLLLLRRRPGIEQRCKQNEKFSCSIAKTFLQISRDATPLLHDNGHQAYVRCIAMRGETVYGLQFYISVGQLQLLTMMHIYLAMSNFDSFSLILRELYAFTLPCVDMFAGICLLR